MEKAVDQGYVKSIGVSNFTVKVKTLTSCVVAASCSARSISLLLRHNISPGLIR